MFCYELDRFSDDVQYQTDNYLTAENNNMKSIRDEKLITIRTTGKLQSLTCALWRLLNMT
jgi:hypothetical protein